MLAAAWRGFEKSPESKQRTSPMGIGLVVRMSTDAPRDTRFCAWVPRKDSNLDPLVRAGCSRHWATEAWSRGPDSNREHKAWEASTKLVEGASQRHLRAHAFPRRGKLHQESRWEQEGSVRLVGRLLRSRTSLDSIARVSPTKCLPPDQPEHCSPERREHQYRRRERACDDTAGGVVTDGRIGVVAA